MDGGGHLPCEVSTRGDNGGGEEGARVLTALLGAFELNCAAGALEDCGNIPAALDLYRKHAGEGEYIWEGHMRKGDTRLYNTLVLMAAITALHKHGFYDIADELYAWKIADDHLPSGIHLTSEDGTYNVNVEDRRPTLDLCNMATPVVHAAVHLLLEHLILPTPTPATRDV